MDYGILYDGRTHYENTSSAGNSTIMIIRTGIRRMCGFGVRSAYLILGSIAFFGLAFSMGTLLSTLLAFIGMTWNDCVVIWRVSPDPPIKIIGDQKKTRPISFFATLTLFRVVETYYHSILVLMKRLSAPQKIALARQCVKFLRRCIEHRVASNFIKRKRLYAICGVPEDSHRILQIEMKVLHACPRSKRDKMYALLKKCAAKEHSSDVYLEGNVRRRIVGRSKLICESVTARKNAS
ncbi:hypothetical protein KIN20_011823 [Parelaphostrongylus tenuis]|uniref:Uncharacterized protein n=1 Tax=Parelaphostrongylus tenuis TaxID=148309 RepID=A0AAD5MSL6_PARTN|nr:hypothetical protein KIN20_011823 [Parelaphostrongylus tenuis]